MPLYDKFCVECNKLYVIEKSYSDNTPFKCPKGHTRLVTKFKGKLPHIRYIGDGWTKKVEKDE
jgi:hypothetical protein